MILLINPASSVRLNLPSLKTSAFALVSPLKRFCHSAVEILDEFKNRVFKSP